MKQLWRPLRIFGIPWHVGHQYSLMTTLPMTEWYLYQPPYRRWGYESRPLPANARFIPFYEKGKYDFALLHVDGECADPKGSKGRVYKKLNELIDDVPKIVINHGTPWLPSRFDKYAKKIDDPERKLIVGKNVCVNEMKKMIGDNTMVVNSKKAKKDWGWGHHILHGIAGNPLEEYYDDRKEHRVVFNLSPAGWPYYYNRRVMEDIKTGLKEHGLNPKHMRVDVNVNDFEEYKKYISRTLIGVYPTRESPTPRSRTEMMLSGCCIVTTDTHNVGDHFTGLEFKKTDEGKFIRTESGELIPEDNLDKAELVWMDVDRASDAIEKIIWLCNHPDVAIAIGQRGKKRAQEVFDYERYRDDWYKLLTKLEIL